MNHKTRTAASRQDRSPSALAHIGLALTIAATVQTQTFAAPPTPGPAPRNQESDFVSNYCASKTTTTIPSGSEEQARRYYHDLTLVIGFNIHDPTSGEEKATTLDDLFKFLGYVPRGAASPLTGKDLQDAAPSELMDPTKLSQRLGGLSLASGDVLVARFFAPKISDVSGPAVTDAGWRKLVRLRALPGSPASLHGVKYAIVLFNFFAPIGVSDPFAGADSTNTQTILVGNDERQTVYRLDFGKTSDGAKLSHALDAFFDAGHVPTAIAESGEKELLRTMLLRGLPRWPAARSPPDSSCARLTSPRSNARLS